MKKILLTTTESLYGWEIENYIKPIFAHVVIGAGFMSDFSASITDLFGGRSNSYEKRLQSVNDSALNILKSKAAELGANCILGLKIDMDQISGKNVQMFMVTAYGTAVVAKSTSAVKTVTSSKEIDKTTIYERAILIRLAKNIKREGYKVNLEGLKAIVESKSGEFKEYLLLQYKKHIIEGSSVDINYNEFNKLYFDYFLNLEPSEAIPVLYAEILNGNEVSTRYKILEIIRQTDLVDYDWLIRLLGSNEPNIKKVALTILTGDKPYYTIEDIPKIQDVIKTIESSFPITANITTKKGFLSKDEKEVWVCDCGRSNDASIAYCGNCSRDKFGFKQNDDTPDKVIAILTNKSAAMSEFFVA